jgi:hypothetical protein
LRPILDHHKRKPWRHPLWLSAKVPGDAEFADQAALAERLTAFLAQWSAHAHPFYGSTQSVTKLMAKCEVALAA